MNYREAIQGWLEAMEAHREASNYSCSCHISAPCSKCTSSVDESEMLAEAEYILGSMLHENLIPLPKQPKQPKQSVVIGEPEY